MKISIADDEEQRRVANANVNASANGENAHTRAEHLQEYLIHMPRIE